MGFISRKDVDPASASIPLAPPSASAVAPPLMDRSSSQASALSFLLLVPLAIGLAAVAALGVMFIYYTITFPDPLSLRARGQSVPVVRVLARDGTLIAKRGAVQDYVPLDLLPRAVTDAVLATEDRRFYEHWGLDPAGLGRALVANLRAGRYAEGGSTLTQQLAKNLFLTPERTLARKVEEVVLALWLELKLSKSDILELYLNRVYFGGGAYGIEAAAQRYFDKSAVELSLGEAALVAGLLKAPSKYAPSASPDEALQRGRSVLAKMRAAGFITEDDEHRANREQVRFAAGRRLSEPGATAYAIDLVMEQLPPLTGNVSTDVTVETTLDAALESRASTIVDKELGAQGEALAASQAAVVVLDLDGGIRALVGGRSYAESQFNRAVKARRQPGSTFKPFVYLAALEAGYTPDSMVEDAPLTVAGWAPRNDNGRYVGPVPLRQALAHSINTVAVRLLLDVGARRVGATARRLGIKSDLRQEASLALGTSEVTLLELTGAYGAFANGGHTVEPYVIRRVRTSAGRVLYARPEADAAAVVAPAHVAALNDMLNTALTSGTGRRAALPLHPAAGKTGTSQDFRDAWFIGYTAYLTAGVWVGNDTGATMNKVMGGGLPADIWRQVMLAAHAGKPPLALPGTGGAVMAEGSSAALAARSHPAERIDEDFVARALAPGTLESGDRASHDGASQSIIVRPPDGLMLLGNRPE
jgi:penicillin-binding protein 1A